MHEDEIIEDNLVKTRSVALSKENTELVEVHA